MMRRALSKCQRVSYHIVDGERVEGVPPGVYGNLSGVRGDLTGVYGDLTGVQGDLTGVRGDVDDCNLTAADRKRGVEVSDLIVEERR